MRISRLLTAIPLLAICTISQGQEKYVVGKLGEAIDPAGIYSSPSTRSRVCKWVQANERLVVRKTSSPNWDAVLLQNGSYGYTKAGNIAELPYTVYAKHRGRTSNYASRGASPVVNQSTGSAIADKALQFQGTPYEWGGNDLYSGIDCSGFVKQLVGAIGGYNLPRTAAEQSLVGKQLTRLEQLQPGDRLYFKQRSDTKISHTGIYIGNGMFVHSSHGKGKVTTDSLLKPGWRKMLVAARR